MRQYSQRQEVQNGGLHQRKQSSVQCGFPFAIRAPLDRIPGTPRGEESSAGWFAVLGGNARTAAARAHHCWGVSLCGQENGSQVGGRRRDQRTGVQGYRVRKSEKSSCRRVDSRRNSRDWHPKDDGLNENEPTHDRKTGSWESGKTQNARTRAQNSPCLTHSPI